MTEYIINNISPIINKELSDRPFWMGQTYRVFSVKSGWNLVWKKKEKEDHMERV